MFWVAPFCEHGLRATLLCRKQTRSSRISSQHLPIHFRGVIWKIKSKSNSPVSFSLLSAQCRNESCRLLSNAERPSDRQPWGVAVNSSFAHKAHQRLGFVHRNLRGAPYKYRETAYQCLVRSQLEYCATVWDPTLKKDINSLEQVQRKAARWACGECGVASVTGLLKKLGWSELADRRWHQRLTLIYKTLHKLIAIPPDTISISRASRPACGSRNQDNLQRPRASDKHSPLWHSFSFRTIPEWKNNHRSTTLKFVTPTALSCIDNSWRSTTLSPPKKLTSSTANLEWCHVHFIRDSNSTFIHQVIGPNKNSMESFFNTKFDFKSTWNHDSTTSHHKHPVWQSPVGEAEKLTNVWSRYFGTNRIIDNWHRCLGVMWYKRKNYLEKLFLKKSMDCQF